MQTPRLLIALSVLMFSVSSHAGDVRAAVAANFAEPVKLIAEQFEADTGHSVKLSYGSTGKFYSQIRAGAPYDVFLSADDTTPEKVAKDGLGDSASRFTYAIGTLVLWSRKPGYVDDRGHVLRGNFDKLAIANPRLAPYGVAAREVLQGMGLWASVKDRIVMGDNITQTWQFAGTGNADLAFVALSQVLPGGKTPEGSRWIVPKHLYTPIRQDAILLNGAKDRAAAVAFLQYLKSPAARAVIQRFGYELP